MNFFLAWLAALGHAGACRIGDRARSVVQQFLVYFMLSNIVLGLFNLLPIPPLDGGRIAVGMLPRGLAQRLGEAGAGRHRDRAAGGFHPAPRMTRHSTRSGRRSAPCCLGFRVCSVLAGHDVDGSHPTPELTPGTARGSWPPARDSLLLRLEGFEGPMDLLLDLARAQKVDLAKISILSLVDQYLDGDRGRAARPPGAGRRLAGDGGVADLAEVAAAGAGGGNDDPEDGELAAEALAARLREMTSSAPSPPGWPPGRCSARTCSPAARPKDLTEIDRSRIVLDAALVRAYLSAIRRGTGRATYTPAPADLWTVQDALRRLAASGRQPAGLEHAGQFLPDHLARPHRAPRRAVQHAAGRPGDGARRRACGCAQETAFGPILVRRHDAGVDEGL